jgi:hypothetical protein
LACDRANCPVSPRQVWSCSICSSADCISAAQGLRFGWGHGRSRHAAPPRPCRRGVVRCILIRILGSPSIRARCITRSAWCRGNPTWRVAPRRNTRSCTPSSVIRSCQPPGRGDFDDIQVADAGDAEQDQTFKLMPLSAAVTWWRLAASCQQVFHSERIRELELPHFKLSGSPRKSIHKNARLMPVRREAMAPEVMSGRLSKARAALAFGVSSKIVSRWTERYRAEGHTGSFLSPEGDAASHRRGAGGAHHHAPPAPLRSPHR